jgi:predicted acyl esterase
MKFIVILIAFFILLSIESSCYTKEIIYVKMSDGVNLYTEVYFPNVMPDEPMPVILSRTPYGTSNGGQNVAYLSYIMPDSLQYVYVSQDIRGTTKSGGLFNVYADDGWGENKDGFETIEWIKAQEWCNGKVGMFGTSAGSQLQYSALGAGADLTCGFARVGPWISYEILYPGGVMSMGFYGWFLSMAKYNPAIMNFLTDNYLDNGSFFDYSTRKEFFNNPMIHIGGWYDCMIGPAPMKAFYDVNYHGGENARGKQKLIIGPWTHWSIGSNSGNTIMFPETARMDNNKLALDWFEYWMNDKRDNDICDMPAISLYLMGPIDITGYWNNWLYFEEWPFTDTDTLHFFLNDEFALSNEMPHEGSTVLIYDPKNPYSCSNGLEAKNTNFAGAADVKYYWESDKIITFETPSYEEAYDIFGNVKLDVYLSSDCPDTDIYAMLVDIYPDGRKIYFADGIQRARHRFGFDREDLLTPNDIAKVTVDLHHTAYTIVPGHKLGLMLSSSNAGLFELNPNSGETVHESTDTLIANNTFHFGGANATVLVLPIRKQGSVCVEEQEQKSKICIHPNPFNQLAIINFELREAGHISLELFDMLGNKNTTLVEGWQEAGQHNYELRIKNFGLNAGMYMIRMMSGDGVVTEKMVFVE